jgi:hypothetical protein
MTDASQFIAGFMVWVAQFVVVSTLLMVVTHLFAKKRRAQKRRAEVLKSERVAVKPESEALETATVS